MSSTIDEYSVNSIGELKPGLKQNLLYLLKRSAKVLKAMYLTEEKDEKAAELDKFVQVFELLEDFIFGDVQYELNKRRQINPRKPEKLPDEGHIRLV